MTDTLPTIRTYGNYSTGNYGAHALHVEMPDSGGFYFSYQTLVAFNHPTKGLVVHQNDWGPTTGKHLNWIHSDKSRRVNAKEFARLYADMAISA